MVGEGDRVMIKLKQIFSMFGLNRQPQEKEEIPLNVERQRQDQWLETLNIPVGGKRWEL